MTATHVHHDWRDPAHGSEHLITHIQRDHGDAQAAYYSFGAMLGSHDEKHRAMDRAASAANDPDAPEVVVRYGPGRRYAVAFRLQLHGEANPALVTRYEADDVRPAGAWSEVSLIGAVDQSSVVRATVAVLLAAYRSEGSDDHAEVGARVAAIGRDIAATLAAIEEGQGHTGSGPNGCAEDCPECGTVRVEVTSTVARGFGPEGYDLSARADIGYADRSRPLEMSFSSTDERDNFLTDFYPDRKATSVPGVYEVRGGTLCLSFSPLDACPMARYIPATRT